ncbi:D-amino acid dehydrogenase [Phenylobacterium sp.]|uniref:D-amino acid dehydrogenase n=1 Tax=Phenylobacterium sp. TaxID=1871053 RepID=UPI00301C9B0C
MRVTILGAGVVGVTTAWYAAQAGHEVTVVERQSGPGQETSFANAGEISPGYASPWAGPGIPQKAIRWLFMRHAPLILRPQMDGQTLGWLFALLRNCTEARYAVNKARMVRLATYSRDQMEELRGTVEIDYDARAQGTLQLFRKQAQLDGIAKDIEVLRQFGVAYEVLDRAGCERAEPGLRESPSQIAGGLRLPADETGDCFKFTERLASLCAGAGVRFLYGTRVERLRADAGGVQGVVTDKGELPADAVVVCLGSWSARLVRPLGLKLPVYPVKGYSITAPIVDAGRAPQSTLLDETYKIAITRLGDRIRVGGMAEISGYRATLEPRRRSTLAYTLESLFPAAGDTGTATFWAGLRPMTPDGTPVIGATPVRGLYLNTGHGTLGWTMACGSGRVMADLLSGRAPEIESADLAIGRYDA